MSLHYLRFTVPYPGGCRENWTGKVLVPERVWNRCDEFLDFIYQAAWSCLSHLEHFLDTWVAEE